MSGFMFSKPCPLCKARNSLEVDYNLGEVVCLQCVKVVANGLMEDEQERFDKDGLTNMDAGEKFAGHDGKPTLSSASDITTAASSGPSRVPLNPSLHWMQAPSATQEPCWQLELHWYATVHSGP